jgi:hypothetical protein
MNLLAGCLLGHFFALIAALRVCGQFTQLLTVFPSSGHNSFATQMPASIITVCALYSLQAVPRFSRLPPWQLLWMPLLPAPPAVSGAVGDRSARCVYTDPEHERSGRQHSCEVSLQLCYKALLKN